ncbi:hypothetical protein [Streptomyces sp. NPDC058084]|uniref:hypothetical protein n=1 Tax=Streptomyces sp. NPDC058084 TaxID=3346333 RepID=UPI0036EB4A26
MPNTFSIPVLRGRDATVLRSEQDGLLLERPGEKLIIPARAIARVHAEARSVMVELRALAGTVPSVHRIEDVSAAAAVTFADAMNASLPQPVEDVDGDALVDLRAITKTWLETYRRRLGRVMLGYLGGVLALALTTAVVGDERTGVAGAVFIVMFGVLAALPLWLGAVCVVPWFHETRLRRHGVTVDAVQADDPETYQYTDGTGTTRVFSHPSTAPSVQASYDPRDPSDVVVLQDPSSRFFEITLGPCFFLLGLGGIAFVIYLAVKAIQGRTLS